MSPPANTICTRPKLTPAQRIARHTVRDPDTGCLLWTSSTRRGYGRFQLEGRRVSAHRVAYELVHGPIPDGLTIDHKCRVRRCCNVDHLQASLPGSVLHRRPFRLSAPRILSTHFGGHLRRVQNGTASHAGSVSSMRACSAHSCRPTHGAAFLRIASPR